MSSGNTVLDPVDQRIVGALQVDGRASWSQIAEILGVPERTVARRGARLLSSGAIRVLAATPRGEGNVARISCMPGMARAVGAALARRTDCTAAYLLTGQVDCFAEIFQPRSRLGALTLDELSGTPGVVSIHTDSITRYFRGVHHWYPGLLADDEVTALAALSGLPPQAPDTGSATMVSMSTQDRIILDALARDARFTNGALGRLAGVSEATARRRVQALRHNRRALIRAVVDPALIGLGVEALLWIRTRPADVDPTGERLSQSRYVRYAAATTGKYQLVAHLAVPDMAVLHECLTQSEWAAQATSVESCLVVAAPKRSGVTADTPGVDL